MKEIIENLRGNFKIVQVIIENFTIIDKELSIDIEIFSNDFGIKTISFENVSRININSEYYTCSDMSSIIIEDISEAQIEGVKYRIAISEGVMTFYCKNVQWNNKSR